MSKMLSWFSTKKGKYFTRTCVGVFCASVFGVRLVIHGPWQEDIRKLFQMYKNGNPKPLSDSVEKIVKEVLKDCSLAEEEKKKITFFNVIGQDLFHLGGTNSPWGASIGLPYYFEKSDEIDYSALRLRGHESIDWIIEGHDLMEALTISDKAKKFGIMREIHACNIWDELDNALILPFCLSFSSIFAMKINKSKDTFNKLTLHRRLLIYLLSFSMGIILYILFKDPLQHLSSKKNDELAASTGPDYLEGGIEFYEHMLMKNKALRQLLGKAGEKKFLPDGNENYFIITPKLPISKRLEMLKELRDQAQKK